VERVILARHGESAYSVRGAMNGDPNVACPLTELGREQAQRLATALAGEKIDLCVTSEFERVRETADLALAGRDVPRLVLAELNDIRVGAYEGKPLAEYRAWATTQTPETEPPGGGEARAASVRRYVRAYATILERAEPTILVVAHGLPIRYLLNAVEGDDPAPAVDQVEYATPYHVPAAELERAVTRLAAWADDPVWPSGREAPQPDPR
jgi:probable phosphoglycerate mutase